MITTVDQTTLLSHLANMIALETAIEQRLEELIPDVAGHAGTSRLIAELRTSSSDHRQALELRLASLGGYESHNSPDALAFLASTALQEVYGLCSEALIGYALLGSLSSRSRDSNSIADEGTSMHLAIQHTDDYVRAIQDISRQINDVLLWELDRDGVECQCLCPSCSVGICLCAAWWRDVLSEAWSEAGPINSDIGIYIQEPKKGSAATQAGLVRGDVILTVNGDEIVSSGDIQRALRDCPPGEAIQLTVRRRSGQLEAIALVHP